MRVLALSALREFWEQVPDAEPPLRSWYTILVATHPQHLADLKATFGSVDYVPDRQDSVGWHIFDVGGNKWRIMCKINYQTQYALIKLVLTHKQYDQWTKERR